MKRLLTSGAMFLCSMLTALAQFSGSGSGTEESPYLIRNAGQLSQMANFCGQDGVVFRLQKDIDVTDWLIDEGFTNQGWSPVGSSSQPFKGRLIGDNHKISGLFILRSSQSYVGLFGCTDGATVSDLTIEGTSFVGSSYSGGLVGNAANSTFTNCHVNMSGSVSAPSGEYVGGFLGYASKCTISNCSVEAIVNGTGAKYIGGFGGGATDGTMISGCTAIITLISSEECTGGLLGYSKTVTVNNSQVNGNVTGTSYVAGYIAYSEGKNVIKDCNYIGNLSGESYIGGITAFLAMYSSSQFTSCFTNGKITASGNYVGGILGASRHICASMNNCSHIGDISAEDYVGGIIGGIIKFHQNITLQTYTVRVSTSKVSNPTTGTGYLHSTYKDKLVDGETTYQSITNCLTIGKITGNNYIGGIIGYNTSSDILAVSSSQTYGSEYENRLTYSSSVYWYVFRDGILMRQSPYASTSYYSGVYILSFSVTTWKRNNTELLLYNNAFMGEVLGDTCVGGIAGFCDGGTLRFSYSNAIIQGQSKVGGIVGAIEDGTDHINVFNNTKLYSNVSYNLQISASSNLGRIYGSAETDNVTIGELGSSVSNRASTKSEVILNGVIQKIDDDLQNGTSVGPSALKTKANYQAWGWDFDNNWSILDGESWPYKKYQAAPPSIESDLVSQETTISGKSLNGGTVYLTYNDQEPIAISCEGEDWSVDMEPLQSGATVTVYAETDELVPSYSVSYTVSPKGEGTEDDPYQIYTAYDLQGISKRGYYKLMNDIDLSAWILRHNPSEGWKPIGLTETPEMMHLDGDNHVIKGLWTNSTNTYNGLFANLSNGGSVKNLTIQVATGKKMQGGDFAGILAGYAVNVAIDNCLVKGDVETSNYAGGLIGYAQGGSITKCYSKGSVKATGETGYAGGLVAWCTTPISNSYSTADVEAQECVAGLVGYSTSTIDKCYAQGNITGMRLGAGLVAQLSGSSATVTNSAALNESITMTGDYASASRVLNGNINGCPDPDESNVALKTMVVTINGKVEKKYDDEWEGTGKTLETLMQAAVYEDMGWDFTNVWGIVEDETVPYLLGEIKLGDVNRDGQTDMTDAVSIVYYYLGERPKVFVEETADINGDGRIDLTDAIIIVYQYLGESGNETGARALLEAITENEPQ